MHNTKTIIPMTLLALLPAALLAASPLDGTWKTNVASVKVTGKPDRYLLKDGMYTCSSCVPPYTIKADGMDHAVSGHDYYDTVMAKATGANSDEIVTRKGGKVVAHVTETVSADGNVLTDKFTNYTGAAPVTGETTSRRVAAAPAGAHPVSGSWQMQGFNGDDLMRTVSYRMDAGGVHMEWNGQHYDARFDGKPVPVMGDPAHAMVSVRKLDDRTIEESWTTGGKLQDRVRLSASADGKSIQVVDDSPTSGQTYSYTLDQQH